MKATEWSIAKAALCGAFWLEIMERPADFPDYGGNITPDYGGKIK